MRSGQVRRKVAVGALMLLGCASPPRRSAPPVVPAKVSAGESEHDSDRASHVPHSCFGAVVMIQPGKRLPPAEALREPELGPEPPPSPEPATEQESVRWARGASARAIARVLDRELPGIQCTALDRRHDAYWIVECQEKDGCQTSAKDGEAMAERIRGIVTPAVSVALDTCPCRNYD